MNMSLEYPKTLEQRVEDLSIGKEVTASEAYWYTLSMLGTTHVAAYTGGRVLKLLDDFKPNTNIKLIVGPHEQDLGHLCQGYFKVSRKPMNIVVTSGPGGTDIATAVKDAHSDGDSLIATIGQVPKEALEDGEEAFQGALMSEPFSYWAKATFRIKTAEEVQSVVKTAYNIATTGRPGPVVIEFPSPIQWEKVVLKPLEEVETFKVRFQTRNCFRSIKNKVLDIVQWLKYKTKLSKAPLPIIELQLPSVYKRVNIKKATLRTSASNR